MAGKISDATCRVPVSHVLKISSYLLAEQKSTVTDVLLRNLLYHGLSQYAFESATHLRINKRPKAAATDNRSLTPQNHKPYPGGRVDLKLRHCNQEK
jgi:hypothetical protein